MVFLLGKVMSKLLIDEQPLVILPSLAVKIGLNEAIFLQQLHYWVSKSNNVFESKKWVYNTYEEWHKQLPFFCIRTLKTIASHLAKMGFIEIRQLSNDKRVRTNFYAINYQVIEDACTMGVQNLHDDECKTCTKENEKLAQCTIYSETTTENTTDIIRSVADKKKRDILEKYTDDFETAWGYYPKRLGSNSKITAFKAFSARVAMGVSPHDLISATANYQSLCTANGNINTSYVMQAQRFYGVAKEYEQFINIKMEDLSNAMQSRKPRTAAEHHAAVCKFVRDL